MLFFLLINFDEDAFIYGGKKKNAFFSVVANEDIMAECLNMPNHRGVQQEREKNYT